MKTTRKRYGEEFKARVAMEAIRGDLTLAELAAKHGNQSWLGLSAQGSATDKWIVCRLLRRIADIGRHAGRA